MLRTSRQTSATQCSNAGRRTREKSRTAYGATRVRVEWLVSRVVGLDPASSGLKAVTDRWGSFKATAIVLGLWDWPNDAFEEDKFDQAWNRHEKCLAELTESVIRLADLPRPPRRSPTMARSWQRASGRLRSLRRFRRAGTISVNNKS